MLYCPAIINGFFVLTVRKEFLCLPIFKVTLRQKTGIQVKFFANIGEKNLPLRNISLWHINCFKLVFSKKQHTLEKL